MAATSAKKLASNKRYRERNRKAVLYHKRNARLRRFGLEPEDLTEMLEKQEYKCLLCERLLVREGRALNSAHLDHCHVCQKVRGLLCKRCNGLIGYIESSPSEVLSKALLFWADHEIDEHLKAKRNDP